MSSALQDEALSKLLWRIPGLTAVLVSSDTGAPLARAVKPSADPGAQPLHNSAAETSFAAVLQVAADQAEKLRFGELKTATSFYAGAALVHVNFFPLVVTLVGDATCNVGAMQAAVGPLKAALEPMRDALQEQ